MSYWLTEIEESLKTDGYVDDLGPCPDCGNHQIYHVNPKGLQALYLLLFTYSRETGGTEEEILDELIRERIDPQLEELSVPDEVKTQLREQAKDFLAALEDGRFQEDCHNILLTIRDFLPPFEDRD